ncbi:hypothetical protein E3U55_08270 [Filobacillus milosensis]|uniref:DUF1795 domain-containing protein n=1 Tax=Filobacillus milosensis TaxID=94137 RepID=A0A4Y8IL46_9BACI|nr:hypothetical protein [Filobacillus milosensis]TFB21808.1 hypothetical protein E3U55_08270 [Filobacillus milosensis]
MLNKLLLTLTAGLLVLSGCGADAEEKEEQPQKTEQQEEQAKKEDTQQEALYKKGGLVVSEVSGWSVGKEKEDPLTVNFNHQNLKAIASVINTDKSFEQLKNELLNGAGDVEVLKEEDGHFSYHSKHEESIRTDVYITQHDQQTLVLSFLSKTDVYDEVKASIKEFQSAVNLQK